MLIPYYLRVVSCVILAAILFFGCDDKKGKNVPKAKIKHVKSSSPKKQTIPPEAVRKYDEPNEQGAYVVEWYGYPQEMSDKKQLLKLLRQEDYAALDSMLMEFQNKFENDYRYEFYVTDAFSAFEIPDARLQQLFDRWVEAFPESYAARIARAKYYSGMGWDARGSEFIFSTTKEQISGMEKYFDLAEQDAARALDLNSKLLSGYEILMGINQTRGDLPEIKRLLDMVLKFCPYTCSIRHRYMQALRPRWSGSHRQMEEFARECEKLSPKNPRLQLFRGYVAWDMGQTIEGEDATRAIEYYSEALTFGDNPTFLTDRGAAYARQKYFKKALRDLDRAIMLRPQRFETLRWRGFVNHNLNMSVQSKLDFELAYQLNPTDSYVQEWARYYQLPPP